MGRSGCIPGKKKGRAVAAAAAGEVAGSAAVGSAVAGSAAARAGDWRAAVREAVRLDPTPSVPEPGRRTARAAACWQGEHVARLFS